MSLTWFKNPWNEHTLEVIELEPLELDLKAFSLAVDQPRSPCIYLTGGMGCGNQIESREAIEYDIEEG